MILDIVEDFLLGGYLADGLYTCKAIVSETIEHPQGHQSDDALQ